MFLGYIYADLSLRAILGYIAYSFTYMLGVSPVDVPYIAVLIGEKLVLTEVVAYIDLAKLLGDGVLASPRSAVITTYALCGFTHIASMVIFVGGLSALACLMTGSVAGVFYSGESLLF